MSNADGSEWKREVNRYIDEKIEAHNTANQNKFRALRDGQIKIEADIAELGQEVRATRHASETAHKSIQGTQKEILEHLKRLDDRLDNLEYK